MRNAWLKDSVDMLGEYKVHCGTSIYQRIDVFFVYVISEIKYRLNYP